MGSILSRLSFVSMLAVAWALSSCGDAGEDFNLARDVMEDYFYEGDESDVTETEPKVAYVPHSARDDQVKAIERANWYREMCGVPPLDMIEAINNAAQAHCDYYVLHYDKYASSGMSPHNEDPQWTEGFTGSSPWDRTGHFGYPYGASEVIAFVHNPKLSVDGWINTLYHRIPFMDASLTACGYGAAGAGGYGAGSTKIDTIDFGTMDADGQPFDGLLYEAIYPPPGSSGIPPSFDGMESPQPPPPANGYPSGTIITITWSKNSNFLAEEHSLWAEEDQTELDHVWLDASNDGNLVGASTIAMYAYSPLKKGTRYWVHIKGQKNGAPWEKTWDFYTTRY